MNFLGVTKTSYIINHAKKNNEYLLGKSLFLWTVAPIPREYWKNKPEISIGKDIAKNIYKKRDDNIAGGGVPPGFIAELYLNFGLVGICTGMFIFGLMCSYSYHLIFQKKSLFRFIVYLTIFFPSIFYLIGGDLSRIIIKFIFLLIIFKYNINHHIGKHEKNIFDFICSFAIEWMFTNHINDGTNLYIS